MPVNLASSDSLVSDVSHFLCPNSTVNVSMVITATRTAVLLPLFLLILCLGYWRWWQPRSSTKTCHADIFTYHGVVMELFLVFGTVFAYYGDSAHLQLMTTGGILLTCVTYSGQCIFHLLTCVERYLAVIHPITYMRLNKAHGVKIRNVSIGCTWLMSFVWMWINSLFYPKLPTIPFLCILVFALAVVSFCSLSVLRVLIHPGPGDRVRDKEQINQSKERAFLLISAITGVLWFWFTGLLLFIALDVSPLVSVSVRCTMRSLLPLFNLPSSLVLPLLFLHRVGWPLCCRKV